MRFGSFGHSVLASTDLPFCCTVGAADVPSPPASGSTALSSIAWFGDLAYCSDRCGDEPVVAALGGHGSGALPGAGDCCAHTDVAPAAPRAIVTTDTSRAFFFAIANLRVALWAQAEVNG